MYVCSCSAVDVAAMFVVVVVVCYPPPACCPRLVAFRDWPSGGTAGHVGMPHQELGGSLARLCGIQKGTVEGVSPVPTHMWERVALVWGGHTNVVLFACCTGCVLYGWCACVRGWAVTAMARCVASSAACAVHAFGR